MLRNDLPAGIVRRLGNLMVSLRQHARNSYSQEGEDLILERFFEGRKSGFYVDVGAHHPTRFSNTFRFYKRGWRGINIEPNPEALALFQRSRKRDINVGCGVADSETRLVYFMFNEPALNTFDQALSEQRQNDRYRIVGKKEVPVKRLCSILEAMMPAQVHIDFMSIDVEGYDLKVLQSNDWSRFRPTCLLVEALDFDLGNPAADPVHSFLEQKNYNLFAKTFNTLLYVDRESKRECRQA
jgi:FkbM family methyltransferase